MGFLSDITDTLFGGSESQQTSFVDPAQQPFLNMVRNEGVDLFRQLDRANFNAGFAQQNRLGGQGQQFLNTLGQAGSTLDPFTSGGFADEQIDSLTDILNRNLQFNLGQINQNAALSNTFGGGRQGLAQGTAIGDTQLALAAGASDILQGNRAMNQQAAGLQGQLMNQGALGGLTQLPGQFNLSTAGFQQAFQPLVNTANIIGGPTILGQGTSGSGPGFLGGLGQFMGNSGLNFSTTGIFG